MARVNVEQDIWEDPRFHDLGIMLGSAQVAMGCLVYAWKLSQNYWGKGRRLVPLTVFKSLKGSPEIITVGLAETDGDFVYVKGTRQHHEWYARRLEQASKGGKTPKQHSSTSPNSDENVSVTRTASEITSEFPKQTEANGKPIYSSSYSEEGRNTLCASRTAMKGLDWEQIKAAYPRRQKGEHMKWKPGFEKLEKLIRTQEEFDKVLRGAQNFAKATRINRKQEFVPMFSTWVNGRLWEEFQEDAFEQKARERFNSFTNQHERLNPRTGEYEPLAQESS